MVPRISTIQAALREVSMPDSSSSVKRSSRLHNPKYGANGTCACMPTRSSIASSALIGERDNSSCRASVARLSARSDSKVN
jgi:hypothetical protein